MQDRNRTPDKTVAQEAERVRLARQDAMQTMAQRASLAQEPRPASPQTPSQTSSESWQRVASQSGRTQEGFQEAVNAFRRNGDHHTADGPIDAKVKEQIVNLVGESASPANKPTSAYLGLSPASTSNAPTGKHGRVPPNQSENLSAGQRQSVNTALGMHPSTTAAHENPPQTDVDSQEKPSAAQAARAQAKQAVQQGQESSCPPQAALDNPSQTGSNSHRQMSAAQAAREQAKQAAQQGKESPSPSMQR